MLLLRLPIPSSWADLAATPGVGALIAYKLIGSANHVATVLCDTAVGETLCATITGANAVKVDNSAVTQPISAATNLPVSQATAANLNATVVQATPANLNATVVGAVTANAGTNLNTSALSTAALQGTNTATTAHTCSVAGFSELGCLGQMDDDIKGPIAAGANAIGFVGLQSNATGGCTPAHTLSTATVMSINVKASAGTLCSITVVQNTTTAAELRLYDSAAAPTCSSATGVVANYGIQSNATSPGFTINLGPFGMGFVNGIGFCLTAYDGTDTNNSATVTGIQLDYATK
jgi:hypothetical protein